MSTRSCARRSASPSAKRQRQARFAPVVELVTGPWRPMAPADSAVPGTLILEGLVVLRNESGMRSHVEVLAEGDLIVPWTEGDSEVNVVSRVSASVLSGGSVALLDRAFALRTARWPELQAALIRRVVTRARRLGLQSAINAIPRIDERLELTLWQLADRFGRVMPDGILVQIPLTHALLAEMLGAQRPSVSSAVRSLEKSGHVQRIGREEWLLRGPAPPGPAPLAAHIELERDGTGPKRSDSSDGAGPGHRNGRVRSSG